MGSLFTHILKFFPDLPKILKILDGDSGSSLVVGGAVRNAVLATDVKDIDIATKLPPHKVISNAKKAGGIKIVPTGLEHGTITLVYNKTPYEITTLRKDIQTDGRHAKVAFTDDFLEDAKRRDFTMNALYLHSDGTITDYFNGVQDLQKGRVKFIGNPEERLREDFLRIIRYFRFTMIYGKNHYDKKLLQIFKKHRKKLQIISGNRIGNEVIKMMNAKTQDIIEGFHQIYQCDILSHITGGLKLSPNMVCLPYSDKFGPNISDIEPQSDILGDGYVPNITDKRAKFTLLISHLLQDGSQLKPLMDFWGIPKDYKIMLENLAIADDVAKFSAKSSASINLADDSQDNPLDSQQDIGKNICYLPVSANFVDELGLKNTIEQQLKSSDNVKMKIHKGKNNFSLKILVEYYGAIFGFYLFKILGLRCSSYLGGKLGVLIGRWVKPNKTALDNIAMVFPDYSHKQHKEIAKNMWENLGRNMAEIPHIKKIATQHVECDATSASNILKAQNFKQQQCHNNNRDRQEYNRHKHKDRANNMANFDGSAMQKSILIASGHFANWEIGGMALRNQNLPFIGIYRGANNKKVDQFIKKIRLESYQAVYPKGKEAARAMIKHIKQNHNIGLLIDQKFNQGVDVPFFNKKAKTAPAIAELALKYELPILPARLIRLKAYQFKLQVEEPIDPTGKTTEEIMRQLHSIMENWIREQPHQWFFAHNRWS